MAKPGGEMELIKGLSPRRREVFDMVVSGKSSAEISIAMGITLGTVKQHRAMILRQLNLSNAVQMTMLAYRAGLNP